MSKKQTYREKHGKTRVGAFLQKAAPTILDVAGDLTGIGALNKLGSAISDSQELSETDKEIALELLQRDIVEAQEITKRWESDNQQDDWLPRNIRPMVLALTILFTFTLIALESRDLVSVKDSYVSLLEVMCLTTIGAYFGLREFGKYTKQRFK